jgi:hypothetical protein
VTGLLDRHTDVITPISGFVFVFVGDDVAGSSLVTEADSARSDRYVDLKALTAADAAAAAPAYGVLVMNADRSYTVDRREH